MLPDRLLLANALVFRVASFEEPHLCSDQAAVGRCLITGCFVHLYGPSHCVNTHCYCKPGYCTINNRSCIKDPKPLKFQPKHEVDNGCEDIHRGTDLYKATFDRHTFAVGTGNLTLLRSVYHPDAILEVPDELGGSLCGVDAIAAFYQGFLSIWKGVGATAQANTDATVCPDASQCVSFRSYSLHGDNASFPMASDTIVYSPRGQIVFQTFAGKNLVDVTVHPHLAKGSPISGCTFADHDTDMYKDVLERHLHAAANAKLPELMNDYHPDAVLVYRNETICGLLDIKEKYSALFKAAEYPGGQLSIYKKTTTCATGYSCQSYVWYSSDRYSQAVEVLTYNAHGQIVSHTWDGLRSGSEDVVRLDAAANDAKQVGASLLQTLAIAAMLTIGAAMFAHIGRARRGTFWRRQPLLQCA